MKSVGTCRILNVTLLYLMKRIFEGDG